MKTFKANCNVCGEFQEQHIAEIVLVHYGDLDLHYRFHCLVCGEKSEAPANDEVRSALHAVGVPVIRLNRQYEQAMAEREYIDREVEKWSIRLATVTPQDFVVV